MEPLHPSEQAGELLRMDAGGVGNLLPSCPAYLRRGPACSERDVAVFCQRMIV